MAPSELHVTITGAEVTKWLLRKSRGRYTHPSGMAIVDGVYVVHSDLPIFRDLAEPDLPYTGPSTVVLIIDQEAFPDDVIWHDAGEIATAALQVLSERGVPISGAQKLQIDIDMGRDDGA